MTNDALIAVVAVTVVFAALHYCVIRLIVTQRGLFERRNEEHEPAGKVLWRGER